MNIQHLVFLFSLLISFSTFGQKKEAPINGDPLNKVDSLIKVRQPNAAQEELWSVIDKAKGSEDHQILLKAYPYFNQLLSPLDANERVALYFNVLKSANELPAPSNSVVKLQLIEQVAYNSYMWFNRGHLNMYDSINMSLDSVRHNFVLENIHQLEGKLSVLKGFEFKPFQEVLLKENDSLFLLQS